MVLRLEWVCGQRGDPASRSGYKASDKETDVGCFVRHLWDPRAKFFYGFEAYVGRNNSWFGWREVGCYQTLGAALSACENALNWYPPARS